MIKKRKSGVLAFKRIESSVCIRESSLAMWLIVVILIMLFVFIFNLLNDFKYSMYVMSYNYGQCIPDEYTDDLD